MRWNKLKITTSRCSGGIHFRKVCKNLECLSGLVFSGYIFFNKCLKIILQVKQEAFVPYVLIHRFV